MSTISTVSSSLVTTDDTTTTSTSSSSSTDSIDFDSFVQLLATELQYQDPTDPVDSTEYVAQMASFASLDKLDTIGNSMDSYEAYSMIGKTVTYTTTDSSGNSTTASGTVDYVTVSDGTPYLNIDGTSVELSSVTKVAETSTTSS